MFGKRKKIIFKNHVFLEICLVDYWNLKIKFIGIKKLHNILTTLKNLINIKMML